MIDSAGGPRRPLPDWAGFTDAVAENLITAGLPSEALTHALAGLLVGEIRDREERPESEDPLTPVEATALMSNAGLVTAAGYAMDLWEAQHDRGVARAFLRSELVYGPAVTRKYGPYITAIAGADGEPIGVAGAERLLSLTRLIEAACRREGVYGRTVLSHPSPYLTVSPTERETIIRPIDLQAIVPLYETGARDEEIVWALVACDYDPRPALAVLRDGIPPLLSDGAL